MAPLPERLDLCCDTAGNEYYDTIVGMSQSVINKNFEELFRLYPNMATLSADPPEHGVLYAKMRAPRIMLKCDVDGNVNTILYQLRFEDGTATFPSGTTVNMKDWELAIPCELSALTITSLPTDTEEEEEMREKHRRTVEKNFILPGDYSVERLFAAIANAKWTQCDPKYSTCGVDKSNNPIPYSQWAAANKSASIGLFSLLWDWAQEAETRGITTLGVRTKVPKDVSIPATFKPTSRSTMVYPYKDAKHPDGVTGIKDGRLNCLLYCEKVDRRPHPSSVQIKYSGNFANAGPSDSPETDVNGTFVIDHRLFFDIFLLPYLQALNQSSEIYISESKISLVAPSGISCGPQFSIGCQPAGTPVKEIRDSNDDYFKFKLDPSTPYTYKWTQPTSRFSVSDKETSYQKYWNTEEGGIFGLFTHTETHSETCYWYTSNTVEGNSGVTVTWIPGTAELVVRGKSSFYEHLVFSNMKGQGEIGAGMKYNVTATWSFKILLQDPANGVMEPKVEGLNPDTLLPLDFSVPDATFIKNDYAAMVTYTPRSLKKYLIDSLSRSIGYINLGLVKRFKTIGKFVYPGNGSLSFRKPMFGRLGNVLAEVDFKPLEVKDGFIQKIALPNAEGKPALPAPIVPKPQTAFKKPAAITTMPLKLTWEIVRAETFDGDKKLRVIIKAQNRTTEKVDFKYIRFGFRSDTGDQPFESRQWFKKGSSASANVKKLDDAKLESKIDGTGEKQLLLSEKTTQDTEKSQEGKDQKALGDKNDNSSAPTPASKVPPKEGEGTSTTPAEGAIPVATDIYSVSMGGGGSASVNFTDDVQIMCGPPSYQLALLLEGKPKVLRGPARGFSTKNDATITFEFEGKLGAKGKYSILIHESWSLEDDNGKGFTEDELLFQVN